MANSEYTQRTTGSFCTIAKLTTPLQPTSTQMAVTDLRTVEGEAVASGSVLLGGGGGYYGRSRWGTGGGIGTGLGTVLLVVLVVYLLGGLRI